MICLRCGYCCINYCVVIVDDPEKGIEKDNFVVHEGNREPCKHLGGDKLGEYFCKIHDRPWYNETPCYNHGQIEKGNTECRIGRHRLDCMNKEGKERNERNEG